MLPLADASGARAFRRSTAVLATQINAMAQLQAMLPGTRGRAGVTRPFLSQSSECTSRTGRSTGVTDAQSRPGAGLQAPPAGTAPAPPIGCQRSASLRGASFGNVTI